LLMRRREFIAGLSGAAARGCSGITVRQHGPATRGIPTDPAIRPFSERARLPRESSQSLRLIASTTALRNQ